MRNALLLPPRSQAAHRIEHNLRRQTERPNYQSVSEFVNDYGYENDYQPLDQKNWLREAAVSQYRTDEQKRRIEFYRYSEDFHFKLFRSILPRSFFGRLSLKMTRRGYLCMASRPLTNSWSWRASSTLCANPSFSTT